MIEQLHTDLDSLTFQMERLFKKDSRLRPTLDMHDYQLTYPPAVHLEKPNFAYTPDAEEYLTYAVGDFKNAAFYFHFGFCQYKCRYCFHYEIKTKHDEDLMQRYVNAMVAEMRQFRQRAPNLKSLIYFLGGGTPTALPTKLLEYFLEQLHDIFGPPPSQLSTVEIKPITATTEKLKLFVAAGFSRINLGVQTLDPELYQFHHHKENVSVALDAIDRARACGFKFINVDILTGLERQTPASWQITLDTLKTLAASAAVDSVFIYPYHDDPRSHTFGKAQGLPSMFETFHSDAMAREMFKAMDWTELGTRFFRAPRHRRRELLEWIKTRANPAYGALLYHGFGNSCFSVGDKATYLNQRNVVEYCEKLEQGLSPITHWTQLNDQQRATRDLTFDILYSPIVRVRSIANKYGEDTMVRHIEELERWTDMGLGHWNRLLGIWRLTKLGKLLHQQMLPVLYLPEDKTGFVRVMTQRSEAGKAYRGY